MMRTKSTYRVFYPITVSGNPVFWSLDILPMRGVHSFEDSGLPRWNGAHLQTARKFCPQHRVGDRHASPAPAPA
ncbi:MAG: hypothetical protein AAGC55_02865, partial [Myxococcota bacterium]